MVVLSTPLSRPLPIQRATRANSGCMSSHMANRRLAWRDGRSPALPMYPGQLRCRPANFFFKISLCIGNMKISLPTGRKAPRDFMRDRNGVPAKIHALKSYGIPCCSRLISPPTTTLPRPVLPTGRPRRRAVEGRPWTQTSSQARRGRSRVPPRGLGDTTPCSVTFDCHRPAVHASVLPDNGIGRDGATSSDVSGSFTPLDQRDGACQAGLAWPKAELKAARPWKHDTQTRPPPTQ
ncbi:hypothetical protein BD413DRAFT_561245 [Trametes elegans]|nr:hypothetical protein BD413DRAFT_561245 [Trametes elegans]